MTIKDYIVSKFQPFGINLSEADISDISMTVNIDEELTQENRNIVYLSLVNTVIPQLLLRAKSISESGFSVSFDTKDVLSYYSWLCGQLGIEDTLSQKPTVKFKYV